jgi:hypothetical protein
MKCGWKRDKRRLLKYKAKKKQWQRGKKGGRKLPGNQKPQKQTDRAPEQDLQTNFRGKILNQSFDTFRL